MIELDVEEYCSQCPEFEPDVDRRQENFMVEDFSHLSGYKEILICNTIVKCEHRARCAGIKSYLETKE